MFCPQLTFHTPCRLVITRNLRLRIGSFGDCWLPVRTLQNRTIAASGPTTSTLDVLALTANVHSRLHPTAQLIVADILE